MKFKLLLSSLALSVACQAAPLLTESFDSVAALAGAGWAFNNASTPTVGTTGWFQGDTAILQANTGAPTAFISANFNNVSNVGTIDNFLITPQVTSTLGLYLSFYTFSAGGDSGFPDHLKVLWSGNGASVALSDFTTVLLDINPTLSTSTSPLVGYPNVWTQYVALAPVGSGRFAFEYQVPQSGPNGTNGDTIGIDTLSIGTPEPASVGMIGGGLLALMWLRRRNASRG